jgi:putative transposase
MVQHQLKLKPNKKQEDTLNQWLWHLTSVHNWSVRKLELDARDSVYYSRKEFNNLLANHGDRLGIPSHVLQGQLCIAYDAWQRCFKGLAKRPRFKSKRNKLNSVPFPDPFNTPKGNKIAVPGLGKLRFHKQQLPEGRIKCGRIYRRASGWYLGLFVDAAPNAIPVVAHGEIGIDPGFKHLLAFSTGEKIEHPRELEASANRLAQAQRGNQPRLASRIQEKIANQRKDRNHKLSRRLVSENAVICFSKDNHRAIAKRFGKSVASSSHGQLRQFLSYKASRTDGRKYIEVDNRNSTRTCSVCGSLTGPQGWKGLKVRLWTCTECGTPQDRDINAAENTLMAGVGRTHEVTHAIA